ncbi:MAG: ATP-binding protein [Ignavibacteriales bacterium]|nr:MAG: ATP-binding protein [Ignavibacteriales bacterium]
MVKINPFKPNSPVPPGMFIGRIEEIERIESQLFQIRAGQSTNFLITGERGIGKSSLLLFTKFIAQGDITFSSKEDKLNFLVIDTDIDPKTTQLGLVKKIELNLRKALDRSEPTKKFFSDVWGFLKKIEAAGFKIGANKSDNFDETAFEEFVFSLSDTVNRLSNDQSENIFNAKYDGVLLLIDEADNSSPELNLGTFLKLLLEKLQRRNCNHFIVGLAGLPILKQTLINSHPSSLRLFEDILVEQLTNKEVERVIDRCLEEAEKLNNKKTEITPTAKQILVNFSEGYPHFIQQFGHCAFSKDNDNIIDENDCFDGAMSSGGALDLIGERYYRDNFYNKVQKESYRQVLRIMAEYKNVWVTKKYIKSKFKGNEAILNNAIKALRDRHIILPKEGEKGIYRLQHRGFALWIKLKTTPPKELKEEVEVTE